MMMRPTMRPFPDPADFGPAWGRSHGNGVLSRLQATVQPHYHAS
jgi:hypothetical protein